MSPVSANGTIAQPPAIQTGHACSSHDLSSGGRWLSKKIWMVSAVIGYLLFPFSNFTDLTHELDRDLFHLIRNSLGFARQERVHQDTGDRHVQSVLRRDERF